MVGGKLKVGLIGCGYWGLKLCRAIGQNPDLDLRWVADTSAEARAVAESMSGSVRSTGRYEDVLSDSEVRAVVVAVPVRAHAEVALAALDAGKDVFVEKPLARNLQEAGAICKAAEDHGRVLMVGHVFLYNDAVRRVGDIIRSGDLGQIRYVFCQRLNLGIVRDDVDVLWDLASHDVSILDDWIGEEPLSATGFGHSFLQPGIDDLVFAHLLYPGNVSGHIQVSWLDPAKVRQMTVVGDRKMLIYDDMSVEAPLAVYDRGVSDEVLDLRATSFANHRFAIRAGDVWLPRVVTREPLANEIADFAHSLRTGCVPRSDGSRALRITRILTMLDGVTTRA